MPSGEASSARNEVIRSVKSRIALTERASQGGVGDLERGAEGDPLARGRRLDCGLAWVKDMGGNGLVGLITLGIVLWLFSNRKMA